jgi:hypothetical protein
VQTDGLGGVDELVVAGGRADVFEVSAHGCPEHLWIYHELFATEKFEYADTTASSHSIFTCMSGRGGARQRDDPQLHEPPLTESDLSWRLLSPDPPMNIVS